MKTGAWLWLGLFALAVALMFIGGCANKAGGQRPPLQVPAMPPTPTIAAASNTVAGAFAKVESAHGDVKTARVKAEAGDAPGAVPPLASADNKLGAALADRDKAREQGAELQARIDALARGHEAQVAAYKSQISNLESLASAATAANKKLAAENAKLKNEVMRKAQLTIGGVGSALLLAAIGCAVAGVWFGFAPGVRIGVIAGSAGVAALGLAVALPKIVLGFAAAMLGWMGYRLWRAHRDTLDHVVAGVQKAKDALAADGSPAVAALRNHLNDATSAADKALIAARKKKVIQP